MTTNERWVLYPLLFLALGIAVRDKVYPPVRLAALEKVTVYGEMTANKIRCNQLEVGEKIRCNQLEVGKVECKVVTLTGPEGNEAIRMGVMPNLTGRLEVCGANGQTLVVAGADRSGHSGVVQTLRDDGFPQVQLHSTPTGGVITTVDRDMNLIIMGGFGRGVGVFGIAPGMARPVFLTRPWQTEPFLLPGRPPQRVPPEQQPPDPPDGQ